jgi:hypothetical protein
MPLGIERDYPTDRVLKLVTEFSRIALVQDFGA